MTRLHGLPHRPGGRGAFRERRDLGFIAAGLVLAVAGIGLTCPARPARAEDGPPKAEALIQKMIDATGGKAAYDKLQSRFTRGKLSMRRAKVELTHTVWAQRPNKSYELLESSALGKTESVCDGSMVWETSQMTGPSLKNGPDRALQLREADFDRWPNWTKYYKSATTAGADSVAGKATWKVEMVPFEGPPETKWMDQTTGLLLKTSTKLMGEMGAIPVEIFIEDYLDACGIKIPSRTRMVAMGGKQELITTIDSVACNPEVPKDRFDMPDEIKALIEKAKTPAAPAEKSPTDKAPTKEAPAEKAPAEKGEGTK
jgi:outer membrane lipoprotein-sorting protein